MRGDRNSHLSAAADARRQGFYAGAPDQDLCEIFGRIAELHRSAAAAHAAAAARFDALNLPRAARAQRDSRRRALGRVQGYERLAQAAQPRGAEEAT